MKKYYFFTFFFACGISTLVAQVSFTQNNNLLGAYSSSEDCAVDMNGDYLDDVVRISNSGISIDFQQEDGSFEQIIYPMSINNLPTWSVAAADINEDGLNDILCGSGDRVSFLKSNGNGYDETVIPDYIFSQRSTFCDIDNDGDIDAFVCHDVDQSHPYRNDGNGNMTEDQSLIETVNLPGNYAAIWVDYDNDGDQDMYLTKCRGGSQPGDPSRTNGMYRNNGDGTFSEVGEEIGMADNAQSWATVFEDFDNDGDFDAFIVNHDFQNRFYENNGDGTFTDIILETQIPPTDLGAWENASGDFNNDGWVDIFSELTNSFYMNNGDMTFTPVDMFLDDGGIGDFNNDGFLDVVKGSTVYLNDTNDNNWVKISTEGIVSNLNGIGARIEIHGEWGIQIREVRSGQSFSPMSSLNTHFGIGAAAEIDQIIIKWPSGIITSLDNPAINTTHHMIEADCLTDASEINIEGETTICPGESVTLNAPDGFESYLWSNGSEETSITVSEPGTYSAVFYNAEGCASVAEGVTIQFANDDPPTIAADGELEFCEGSSVNLTSSIGADYTWSNDENTQSINVTESGTYTVAITALCGEELLFSEPIEVDVLAAPAPETMDVIIGIEQEATLEATGENLHWYDVATGGDVLGMGNTFTTPPLTDDATYYVEAHYLYGGDQEVGGLLDINENNGGLPSTGAYSYFDAYEPFTIKTVDVFVPNNAPAGTRTIQLLNQAEELLAETAVDLEQGLSTITLDFEVPEGINFTLRCLENNLFRNDNGVSYPYEIGTVGAITGSFYGDAFYYYFYNWQIEKESTLCISERVEVSVEIVNVDDLQFVNAVEIFPNPTNSVLNIQVNATQNMPISLQLVDVLGHTLAQQHQDLAVGENAFHFNVADLPTGIYQLQLLQGENVATWKVIVE